MSEVLYPLYIPVALAGDRITVIYWVWVWHIIELTLPDLDESAVHRFASTGIHNSKVHEKFHSPIAPTMRMERQYA